jgi:DNA-binding CsgD family transcriptional regulator
MNTIDLTTLDLEANQRGLASQRQLLALRRQRWIWIAGTVACVLLVALIILLVVVKFLRPTFADEGQLLLALPLLAAWLWLLKRFPRHWQHTNQDLRVGKIASMQGVVRGDMHGSIGIIRVVDYAIWIDDQQFSVSKDIFWRFKMGDVYRIYYAPMSKLFLGACTPTTEPHDIAQNTGNVYDLLTAQETELLRLIAQGLSNKEIAVRLSFSVNTIKMYVSQIYRKLDVSRRTEAVARARELHLL